MTKNTVDCDCIVITCNPNLVFAYLVDTSLMDPNYELHVEPVKRPAKVARPNAVGSLVPAFITVTRKSVLQMYTRFSFHGQRVSDGTSALRQAEIRFDP